MIKPRPDYCPDNLDPDKDCPACGEPPTGKCRAIHNYPKPEPYIKIILVDRDTGEPI